MADRRRLKCKLCHRRREVVGPISWGGYCGDCGPAVFHVANDDMHYHRGPYFHLWRRAMAASVGGVLLDDIEPEP